MTPAAIESLGIVLKHEGGWSDNPADPGGATMRGITLATYSKYLGRQATKAELRAIPDDHLQAIYDQQFWQPIQGDALPLALAITTFDAAVMSGQSRASKWLQSALGVTADGSIGAATVGAARRCDLTATVKGACANRLMFLKSLPTWPTFGRGWESRVYDTQDEAIAAITAVPSQHTGE